jgi:hypothetical protein
MEQEKSNQPALPLEDLQRILNAKRQGREALSKVMEEIWKRDSGGEDDARTS